MKKMQIILGVLMLTAVSSGVVFAARGGVEKSDVLLNPPNNEAAKDIVVNIPDKAAEVLEDVYSLGTKIDPETGLEVEGYLIVDRKDEHARSNAARKPGGSTGSCFAYIANGANWRTAEPYRVHDQNPELLNEAYVAEVIERQVAQWEDANDGTINGVVAANVFGTQTIYNGSVNLSVSDGNNDVTFGVINEANVIAVTYVWGTFSAPPQFRQLVEWDQVYNTNFAWSDTVIAGTMNFENIAAHELGHAFGMGHPENSCTEETMFWSAGYGETKKISLNVGDIAGINKLY